MSTSLQCTEECCYCSAKFHGRKHGHREKFPSDLQLFLADNNSWPEPMTDSNRCVCRACEVSAKECMKKNINEEVYRLRWHSKRDKCSIPLCPHTADIFKHTFSWQDICDSIGITSELDLNVRNQPLCSSHYQAVYRTLNPSKVRRVLCHVCGVKQKHEHSSLSHERFVACPDHKFVESYLRETVGVEAHIDEADVLCFRCYKYFNKLLKAETCTLSSEEVLAELKVKECSLKAYIEGYDFAGKEVDESAVHLALCQTALHAYSIVLADQAFLFPDIYKFFLQLLPLDINDSISISRSRLLTFLGNEFGNLVTSYCSNNKTGMVFHRAKADFHVLLSNALGKHGAQSQQSDTISEKLNNSVHDLVNHMLSSLSHQSESLILDVDSFIQTVCTVAPDLWEHVRILTQSVNEHKGRLTAVSKSSSAYHLKRLRRAYLLSVLLFVSNSECSFPFHVLLADAVDTSGASTELMTILNRIGAVASVDTLKRVILTVSQDRRERGIQDLLVAGKFTVASVDNIDFLQSHAAVYSGSQHRSWHATSIQLVQPYPLQAIACDNDANASTDMPDPVSKLRSLLPSWHPDDHNTPLSSFENRTKPPKVKKHRARTFSERIESISEVVAPTPLLRPNQDLPCRAESNIDISSFQSTTLEKQIAGEVRELLFDYFLMKEACSDSNHILVDSKSFCGLCLDKATLPQVSNVVYLSIIDMHADSREAMEAVVSKLHREYGVGERSQHLVVVGDQKTYCRLQELKHAYGSELDWLVPFIGDWHLLLNFHSVLMKVYYDAGLKDLAVASGFRGETLTSLQRCSNFKRTHAFILQSLEALYRHFLQEFINSHEDKEDFENLLSSASAHLCACDQACLHDKSSAPLKSFLTQFRSSHTDLWTEFDSWLEALADLDPNWKFWSRFILRDAFSYFCLFFAIRSGTWDLRMYAIKQIGPLFAAFDRPHYQKLIPCHLHEVFSMPEEVISCFENGSFVCNVTGSSVHSVALDEGHEMLVNKDLKTTIIRPTKEYVDRVVHYFPVRAQAMKALKSQVFLDGLVKPTSKTCIFDTSPHAARVEENVKSMISKIQSTKLLSVGQVQCLQSFSAQVAKPEQERDLLSFYQSGVEHFKNRIEYFVLRIPSAKVPQRQLSLLTYSSPKTAKRKIKLVDRERKIVSKCVRRSLAWNTRVDKDNQQLGGQYLELPRAISDPYGKTHTGVKSYATKWLEKRYEKLVSSTLPSGWTPDVVLLEGMFLIQTSPLSTHHSMKEYSSFLLKRFALPHFVRGSMEVHILFDNPGRQPNSPKNLERQRRDQLSSLPQDHQHSTFADTCSPPPKWRELLGCRECKRKLVLYLGDFFLHNAHTILQGQQSLTLAGCFSGDAEDHAWVISLQDTEPASTLNCDAEEADTRVWLHALRSRGTRKLVCSPDTDVFHIGLPIVDSSSIDVIVQLNTYTSMEHRYLHLDALCTALHHDPDLSEVPQAFRSKWLQTLFICTGCDYTSFFAGIGKATFMRVAFQYCNIISADTQAFPGCLSYTMERKEEGYLAFLRLVGTAYFAKHRSCFQYTSPRVFLNSFGSEDPQQAHKLWFNSIRTTVWERIEFEDELPPSVEALWRHWLRTCWVSHYWSMATRNRYNILDITLFGWKLHDGEIEVDWDHPQNVTRVRERVQLLLHGCGCKRGCSTRRCSCVKSGKKCGPGCTCCNCVNAVSGPSNVEELETVEIAEDEAIRQQYFNELVDDEDEEEVCNQDHSEDSSVDEDMDCALNLPSDFNATELC